MFTEKSPKVLIVDDIPKNIQVVGNILQDGDYDIYFASNGQMALNQAVNNDFDLILLDIMMPEMDGFEVCEHLKSDERTKEIPIIFLTAKTDTESAVKGFKLGGVDYITKPFNGTELLARIQTHLNLKFSQEKLSRINKELAEKNKQIEEQKAELEAANQKLSQSEANLRELNATKDKFFSIVAHDLKNPFNTLIGFSDVLVKNFDMLKKEQVKNINHSLYNASKRGYSLLENLLDWSRAQTGRIEWKPEKISIEDLIDENIDLLGTSAGKKNIELIKNINTKKDAYADPNMVKTVIRNLISNAIKFTDNGGEVTISLKESNGMAEVEVKDTGVGIEDEDMKKLFRIDVNHSTIGTAKEKGTGLGLILCKEFVEKNGGKIWVKSRLGEGSRFGFSLPLPSNF